ncbi:MAG: hypothetical protein K5649_08010 [Lachnospiraceae bacterium]|nr:hypothetical protein [Lachnospiraceae bacterium]
MKKKAVSLILAGFMALSLIACGGSDTKAPDEQPQETQEEVPEEPEEAPEEEAEVGMANPWVESSEEEAIEYIPRLFQIPNDATNVEWHKMDTGTDFPGPLFECDFDYDGLSFCARAQCCAEDHEPIDGMYYTWDDEGDYPLATWGGGEMMAHFCRYAGEDEFADLATWYDYEIGIAYSLSTVAEDLDGFDIQSVVEAMAPMDEFMPSSFVEEDTGLSEFESFDEIISYLSAGDGYAYIELLGYDGELLAITDEVCDFDGKNAATAVYLYGKWPGEESIANLGNAFGEEGYPIRVFDGLLYCCSEHIYEADCISKDSGGLMVKEYINEYENDEGELEYTGFLRESNEFEADDEGPEELPEDADVLYVQYQKDADKAPVLEFTVVE